MPELKRDNAGTGALVQARTGSRRLPGKVVRQLEGRALLLRLLDSLRHATTIDTIVVTTSLEPADDQVADLCKEHDVECFRGPLDNVSLRMLQAAERYELETVVRVSGDSPMLDHRLVDQAVLLFRSGSFELVTNVFPRSFPRGQSVEVLGLDILRHATSDAATREELEHVTLHVYESPERYRIHNFSHAADLADISMSVDTAEDATRVEALIRSLSRSLWEYHLDELVEVWRAINSRA